MTLSKETKILIVGLGVMGGSYAAALTERGYRVSCLTKERSDIDYAIDAGIISYGTTELSDPVIGEAELVVFALYPTIFIDWIEKNQHLLKSGALITDVTGVKGSVVERIQNMLRPDIEFIAAHPMAGRERSGVEFSDPSVFRGANYIITPTRKNTDGAIRLARELGEVLGFARISTLSPDEHDRMIAFLSQLTHCIAVTLMNCNSTPELEKYTGDSFRDLTRIAKINDRMWSELFLMNREALLAEMDAFAEEFSRLHDMIRLGDSEGLRAAMRASCERRSLFDKPKN